MEIFNGLLKAKTLKNIVNKFMVKVRYSVPHEYRPHREHRSKKNKRHIGGRDGKLWRIIKNAYNNFIIGI